MSLSYQTRLIVTISLLAAGISAISSYIFYQTLQSHVWTQTASRLKDIGRAGQYLITLEDRKAIRTLDDLSEQLSDPRPESLLKGIRPGENYQILSDSRRQRLEQRPDYQRLVQLMRRIKSSTRQSISEPGAIVSQKINPSDPPLLRYAYILVPVPESPDRTILKFIVDGDDQRLDTNSDGVIASDEEATQIGMLYNVSGQPQMLEAFQGEATASEEYYRDEWGVWLSAYIPIKDESGETFAVMGIDLSAESEFSLINRTQRILVTVIITSVFVAGLLGLIISRILSRPLLELTRAVEKVQERDFSVRLKERSGDEFGQLARAFNSMVGEVESYTLHMEDIVVRKTGELRSTLRKVEDLKNQQDADYYLTTMLANPLLKNGNVSDSVHTDFLIEYKKKFKYQKWEAELGGDLCVTGNVDFDGEAHAFFFNGDATGGALNGAGGSLIMGALVNSILMRKPTMEPIQWMVAMVEELHGVFSSFHGEMQVGCLLGLIQERSGILHLLNAGHPRTVLYRKGQASFLEQKSSSRRIGEAGPVSQPVRFQLETGDVLIAGSDGRDSIRQGKQRGEDKSVNLDPDLFTGVVERGRGELHGIREVLYSLGEPTDDISLMRIAYRESAHPTGAAPGSESLVDEVEKLIGLEEYDTALSLLAKMEDENFYKHYYSGLCYSRTGDQARALESLQEARNLVGERASVLYLLGQVYADAGRNATAIEVLQKAAFLQPEDDRIKTLLENLQSGSMD
ncbi:MAG: SpoIIE family protein phosphatase [Leptospiraceae bacterium]